jgi:serine/threonine protein kinase/Tol biopolymer transport system component
MNSSSRRELSPDLWRRIGAVLDRLSDTNVDLQPDSVDEACRSAGVAREIVEPFLAAERHSDDLPERVEPTVLHQALSAHARDASTTAPPLEPGTRLGVYEIVALIGAGGMGDVYKARDVRLDRTVALKVLRPQLAERSDVQQRFEREARALSSLNHPHICTLHDIGHDDRVPAGFLVMELVEGETLAARLQRRPLPVAQALEYAAQIADALAIAHRHGIVHRDLKPANVMLTAHGVKLLDFGLAALRPASGSVGGIDGTVTAEGAIFGTLPYMSPEQIQGKPTDERTDIFALGAIVYEMLTRRRAFEADNPASVIAAVLERDPPQVSLERGDVPAAIDRVLGRCLAKSPDGRWQSASDLASELRWLREAPAPTTPVPAAPQSRWPQRVAVAAIVLAAGAAGLASYWFAPRDRAQSPMYRFPIAPPDATRYLGLFALSPDGQRLVFTAVDAAGVNALWLRPLDVLASERLAGTEGARYPFWSPDGRAIGFFSDADRKLKIVDVATGGVRVLCDAGRGGGATWNADGVIVFAPESGVLSQSGLMRVTASGGEPTPLTMEHDASNGFNVWPQFLPDGRHYLYTRVETSDIARAVEGMAVYVGSLDGNEVKKVVPERRASYANDNLFWVHEGRLMSQPFDLTRLEVTGEPVQIAENVEQTAPGRAAFDVANGVLAYRTGRPRANQLVQLTWLDRTGREVGRVGEPAQYSTAVVSPDARYVLAVSGGNVRRIDVGNGTATPLPERGATSPVWNPDGTKVAFTGGVPLPPGPTSVSVRAVDGSGPSDTILSINAQVYPNDWSTNGQFIVGSVIRANTGYDLFATRVGSHTATFPVAERLDETDADLSPDMNWIAYAATDESGRWDIWVRSFGQSSGAAWRVSRSGGRHPRWSGDGRELFYVTPDGALMSAVVGTGSTFRITDSHELFQQPAVALDFNTTLMPSRYDVTRDGKRFLVRLPAESGVPEPIVVLLNWPTLLQR